MSSKLWRSHDTMKRSRLVIIERSGGHCETQGFSNLCTGVGTLAHHIVLRSQHVDNSPENLAWICSFCHADIHQNPERARAYGLIKSAPPVETGLKNQ